MFALGDLRPGNSPASVLCDGNLFSGTSTETFIELSGLTTGAVDQMVSLIDGHLLGLNQQNLIGDIGGTLIGQFNGLTEGSLVGTFGGKELFITHAACRCNGIALFTAIPEQGPGWLMLAGLTWLVSV